MTKILLILFSLALILSQTNGVIQCGTDVLPKVKPCGGFVLGQDPTPSNDCCVGLQDLAKIAAASQSDRKDICICFKALMKAGQVNFKKSKQLPGLCKFTSFMPITPNPDCSK